MESVLRVMAESDTGDNYFNELFPTEEKALEAFEREKARGTAEAVYLDKVFLKVMSGLSIEMNQSRCGWKRIRVWREVYEISKKSYIN